ncbi:M23 family metallopeptidase [Spirillospora sp. CA-294931]|uniref:M23 family metallopeptidase n=1 Tax=Spirillospora sp. CA-294931 TaxID=3240042 RepID=UPI003D93C72C
MSLKLRSRAVAVTGAAVVTAGAVATGVVLAGGDPGTKKAAPVAATANRAAAQAAPAFRLPFPCGQVWTGNSNRSSAHTRYEIDFNRGSSPEADNGHAVVAAAAGTVVRSTRHVNQSGFGNHVVIQHSGGYATWYAHLKYRSVKVGQKVASGTKIGAVGRTTRPSNSGMSSHLHYEVRLNGGYPPVAASFGGRRFAYPQQTLKACAKPPAPHPVTQICGAGYRKIDEAALRRGGKTYGRVYLGYKSGYNCVITVKPKGAKTAMSATLQVRGAAARTDRGNYTWYAGPIRSAAGKKCVKWGGSIGSAAYTSPFEHCG